MRRSEMLVHEKDGREDIDLTPMLDVVFIMLIFFIVTASFTKESGIDVNRHDAEQIEVPESEAILIAISKSNEIWLDQRLIDPRALRANIARLHATLPDSGLVIQPDRGSTNNTLVQVMDAARQAGIYDISITAGGEP